MKSPQCPYATYNNVHSDLSVIRLVVITEVISHSFAGHQGLPSVHAKLTNTIWEELKLKFTILLINN